MAIVGLLLQASMIFAGCGRTALERPCATSADCPEGLICDGTSTCVIPSSPDETSDLSDEDVDTDEGRDLPPDLPVVECETIADCPGAGAVVEQGSQCLAYQCVDNICQSIGVVKEICPEWQRQQGCETCEDIECRASNPASCGDFLCLQRTCSPCARDSQCDDGEVCGDDGRCKEDRCEGDRDCKPSQICQAGACLPRPECLINDDCADDEVCLSGQCSFSPECRGDAGCEEGFECINNRCFEEICRGPDDCDEDLICDAGKCVEPLANIVRCEIATPPVVTVAPGERVALEAFAYDSQGNGSAATFQWDSSAPAVARVATPRSAVAGTTAGTAIITATLDGGLPIMCEGQVEVTNVGRPPAQGLRVIVLDAETGSPVSGANVVVGSDEALTTRGGVASLPAQAGSFDVSVFSDDYNYVSVLNVDGAALRITLNGRSGSGPRAGFTGQFDMNQVSSNGDFNIGLAGASIAGGLVNFDLSSLLGDPFVPDFDLPIPLPGGGGGDLEIPVPGGLTLFGRVFGLNVDFKSDYYANTPGGARLAWGLGGKIPSQQLIQLFQNGGIGNLGDVLALLLPLFNRFDHALRPEILTALPRLVDSVDYDNDGDTSELLPDYANFPDVDLTPNVQQQLFTDVSISNFPQLSGGPGQLGIIVGGALLQTPGFVPLGITATNDNDGDGRPDLRVLTMAPPYGSLAGARFAVLAISIRTDSLSINGQGGLELPDEFSIALWNGQNIPTRIQMGTFPDGASGAVNTRRRRVTIDASAGPVYRARFIGQDRSWDVWAEGPAGTQGSFSHTFNVPDVPAGATDLMGGTKVLVDSIRTQTSLQTLVSPTGVYLHDVTLVSTSFNRAKLRD